MLLPEALTVLAVDDSTTARKVLVQMLKQLGCKVLESHDAESALVLMADHHIDAFLLDIDLPGMSGIELCLRLRGMDRYRHTPVIFVTALEEDAVLEEAFAAGGDDVVIKPVSQSVLGARLGNHLKRMEAARRLAFLQRNLNLYVCPRTQEIAEQQARTGKLPPPEVRDVCVLFSDVRGFTQLSQEIAPKLLFSVLSEHLGAQVRYVYRFGGYIDKFSGDGIMAVFDGPDMVSNSAQCALKIVEYARQQAETSVAPLYQLGVGIHRGEAMIGNIGSERQLDYTVIGPTVNLAARLCGHAEALSVVVSQSVYEVLEGDPCFRFSDPKQLSVKGVKQSVPAYVLTQGQKVDLAAAITDIDALLY